MKEKKYEKLDDQTLAVSQDVSELSNDSTRRYLRQIFNFRAKSVTTIYETRYGSSSSSSTSPTLSERSFSEIDGKGALHDAFDKLVELGGNPDLLEEPEHNGPRKKKQTLKID